MRGSTARELSGIPQKMITGSSRLRPSASSVCLMVDRAFYDETHDLRCAPLVARCEPRQSVLSWVCAQPVLARPTSHFFRVQWIFIVLAARISLNACPALRVSGRGRARERSW